jgi:hypothetical protein
MLKISEALIIVVTACYFPPGHLVTLPLFGAAWRAANDTPPSSTTDTTTPTEREHKHRTNRESTEEAAVM